MNITAYNEKTRYLMPLGMAILKGGYYIASADEYLYKYLDMNSDRTFTELIHPEDRQLFLDAANKVGNEPQYVLVRFITIEANYKYMLLRLKPDKFVVDGFQCIEVYVADIIASMEKHMVNRVNLTKYRRAMCLADYLYFDYDKKTNQIKIYMYANDKSYMFLAEDLDVWREQMLSSYLWKDVEKRKFETLYGCIKDGLDDFKIHLATTFFSKGKRSDSILISGSIFFDTDGTKMVTGVIKLNSGVMDKPYYTTEASKDSATGLMNKRAIMEYAAQKITEAQNKKLALFVVDIDDFKNVNDTYGHLFGDQVIFRVAETIKRIVGIRGTVARFGGDEFVVLLEDCDRETLEYIVKTIYGDIGLLFKDSHVDLHVTISTGISNYPENGTTYEELFQKADKALYVAKGGGKNKCVVYDEELHREVELVNEGQRMKGLKSIASRVNRSVLFSEIILALSSEGQTAISKVSGKICDLFDVSGMSVFTGEDLMCSYSYGKYSNKVEKFTLLNKPDFVELITEDDMIAMEDVRRFGDKSFYENYRRLEINANLTSIYRLEGQVGAVVTFDTFNTSRQWNEADMISLNAIGKLIGQKVCENS